jgi:OFA family oxalate/formate antiporter-like MFS transporter
MKWFPDNRGLVTGVAVAGFGGGAIILSSLAEYLMVNQNYSVMQVFYFTGLVFGLLALLSAAFISEPPNDEAKQTRQNKLAGSNDIFSGQFLLICIGMFAGTFAGLLIVGNLKPLMLGQDLSEFYATLSISLFAVGNILGRVLWGQVHDRLQSRKAVLFSFVFFLVALFLLLLKGPTWMALASTTLVGGAFGGCFVLYASAIVEKYGVEKFSKLYPICFLAYGLAALVGPPLGGWLADRTGSYASGLYTSIGGLVVVGLLFVIFFQNEIGEEPEVEQTYA